MRESWEYDKKKWLDKKGDRWHFVSHHAWDGDAEFWYKVGTRNMSFDLYFCDDARTTFGVIRFPHHQDNPYHWYDTLKNKIITDKEFRKGLIDPETKQIWKKNWK
jgi:hypothetical protein